MFFLHFNWRVRTMRPWSAVLPPTRSTRRTSSVVDKEDPDFMSRKLQEENSIYLGVEVS